MNNELKLDLLLARLSKAETSSAEWTVRDFARGLLNELAELSNQVEDSVDFDPIEDGRVGLDWDTYGTED